MEPILNVKDLVKTYSGSDQSVRALDGVSLELHRGEIAIVRGPSGSGKSTLLFCCGILLAPDAGTVRILGEMPYTFGAKKRAQFRSQQLGFVFQRFHLLPYLNVLDNVLTAAAQTNATIRHRAEALLERLGMTDRLRHCPGELSVGERQRTALARAMLNNPPLLLADEPTGNLDPENSAAVLEILKEYAAQGHAVLMVTHDTQILKVSSNVFTLEKGQIK
jgi:ABC-type lipoprotein export system ATPase subunit